MIIRVKDLHLLDAEPLKISSYSDTITLVGDIPTDALVNVHINGVPWDAWFPLVFSKVTSDGSEFTNNFILEENIVEYIRKNPFKKYTLSFEINMSPIDGQVELKINMPKLMANGKTIVENDYKLVLQELAKLNRKINLYINRNHIDGLHIQQITGLKEGMIPIVMDSAGHLKFDFPFLNIESTIKDLTDVIIKLTESYTKLVERLNSLELNLHNHVNQSVL